ncbi:MAG: hypothetical protein WCR21_07950 [Bacteroidota bacterium]
MKNISTLLLGLYSKRNLIVGVIILCTLSNYYHAQITTSPYIIYNTLNCDAEIHWRIVDNSLPACPPLCNGNNIIIPGNSSININCAVPNTSCIEVVLLKLKGVAIIPNPYVSDNGSFGSCMFSGPTNDSGIIPLPAQFGCGSSTWSITYTGSSTTIAL